MGIAQNEPHANYELQIPNYENELAQKHDGFIQNRGQLGSFGSSLKKAEGVSYYSNQALYSSYVQRDKLSFIHSQRIHPDSSKHEVNKLNILFFEQNSSTPRTLSPQPKLKRHQKHNFYTSITGNGIENVNEFGELYFQHLYEGIDMSLSHNQKGIRAHFAIEPKYDPLNIRIGFEGLNSLSVSGNNVQIGNYAASYTFLRPIAYQIDHNDLVTFIPVNYGIDINGRIYFNLLGVYDAGEKLFISIKQGNNSIFAKDAGDNMEWSSYIGSAGLNALTDVAADDLGNSVYVGQVESALFMSGQSGYFPIVSHAGRLDGFIIKFNTLMEPQFFTYIGGSATSATTYTGSDILTAVTTELNQIYLVGGTTSTNFPLVDLANTGYQAPIAANPACNSCYNVFYAQLNLNGILQYSTNFGNSENEFAYAVLRKGSNTFVLGERNATTPSQALPGAYNSAVGNGLIMKFNAQNALTWATGFNVDRVLTAGLNESLDLIIGGSISSTKTLPMMNPSSNMDFNSFNGGNTDGFIAIFNQNDVFTHSAYYGTNCDDYITDLVGTGSNQFYGVGMIDINGNTCGGDLPVLGNGLPRASANSSDHMYFSAYPSPSGIVFSHSGYFGGAEEESMNYDVTSGWFQPAIALTGSGFAITGATKVVNASTQKIPFPTCNPVNWYERYNCYIKPGNNFNGDAYVAIFNFACELKYSTYFGDGEGIDGGTALAYTNANGINRLYFGGNANTQNEIYTLNQIDFLYVEEFDISTASNDYFRKIGNAGTNFNHWGAFFNLDGINVLPSPCNLSVEETTVQYGIELFPNPNFNQFTLKSESEILNFSIFDITGRKVYSSETKGNSFIVSTENFSSGEYILRGNTESATFNLKLIKQ